MKQASASEHNYFDRVARQNRSLPVENPPNSLAEMFERLALLRLHTGQLAEAGQPETDDGDLRSHQDYLKRLRRIDHSYST